MSRSPNAFQMWWWQRRIRRMRRCKTADELRAKCGIPDHEVAVSDMTIWHYPLRAVGGTLYSIHVALVDGQPRQVFLHMEPTVS